MHKLTVQIISAQPFLLYATAPSVSLISSRIRLDDWAKLHYTSEHFELQSSSHSSVTMKLAISHFAVNHHWILPNAIMAENTRLPATVWLWLAASSTILYLYKVMRVRHINALDWFRKHAAPSETSEPRARILQGYALYVMCFVILFFCKAYSYLKDRGWITDQPRMLTAVHSEFRFK